MTHKESSQGPVEAVAARVKAVRRHRGLTAAQLAQRMQTLGVEWNRNIVANLENGRRGTLGVDELFALAIVLDVAPVHLLVPLDDQAGIEVARGRVEEARRVRWWIRGDHPLDGIDDRLYFSEVPKDEWGRQPAPVVRAWNAAGGSLPESTDG